MKKTIQLITSRICFVSICGCLLALPIQAVGQQLWDGQGLDGEWTNGVNWTCTLGGECDDRAPNLTDSACNFASQSPSEQTNIYVSADTTVTRIQLRNNCPAPEFRIIQIGTNALADVTLGLSGSQANYLANQKTPAGWDFVFSGAPNDYGARLKLRIDSGKKAMEVKTAGSWLTVSCDIYGNAGFEKTLAGQLILSGTNTYFGETTISDGEIVLGNPQGLGFGGGGTVVSAGALDLNGQSGVNEILTLNGTGISDAGALINSSGTPASLASGALSSISVTAGGSAYSSPPTVTISGGGGSGATADALLGLTDASITIDNGGSGYDLPPYVIIDGGGGTGATATSAVDESGVVTNITVTAAGLGYTSAPTITLLPQNLGGGGTASANATEFTVAGVLLTDAGSGYSTAPTVGFSSGGGSGATANANFTSVTLASDSSVGGSGDITIEPEISGGFGLTKVGANTLKLTGANTYSGATTVSAGTLLVNSPGSLAASSAVTVASGGTLGGNGTVGGSVTIEAGGTLSPGGSVGNLTLNSDLTLAGNLYLEVNKPTNDVVLVAGALSNTGTGNTVTVANVGGALSVGDKFQILTDAGGAPKAMANGGALTVVSSGGVTWNNNLAVDGSITVASVGSPRPSITSITGAGTASVIVNYNNCVVGKTYFLQYKTTIAGGWTTIGTGQVAAVTSDSQTDNTASGSERYYQVYYVAP